MGVELTSGDDSEHVRRPTRELHLLAHTQSLVDLDEVLGREDLHRVLMLMLNMADGLSVNVSHSERVSHLVVLREKHNCDRQARASRALDTNTVSE